LYCFVSFTCTEGLEYNCPFFRESVERKAEMSGCKATWPVLSPIRVYKVRAERELVPDSHGCNMPGNSVDTIWQVLQCCLSLERLIFGIRSLSNDRLCGLVVRVLGYRSGGLGSIPGTTRKIIVGLERGPLSLVSTTEELLDRKVAAPV
jgi:hypothetical protein